MTAKPNQPSRSGRGKCRTFSLVEIIAVLTIVGILAAIAGTTFTAMVRGFSTARDNTDTIQKGQLAMTRLEKEFGFVAAAPTLAGGGTSATYTTEYPGQASVSRTVSWDGTVGSSLLLDADILVDNVQSFLVSNPAANLVEVTLTLGVAGGLTFSTSVYYE